MKIQKSLDKTIRLSFGKYSAVIIPTKEDKSTVCVSCQIGCPVKCKFCYSGKLRFERNLSSEEIVEQFDEAKKIAGKVSAVVFMGSGEPTLNIENVLDAAEKIQKKGIAYDRITISTSGLKTLDKLIDTKFNVAISLHSGFDKKRKELIPPAISVRKIISFIKKYNSLHDKKKHVMIEYSLIKGVNDSDKDLKKLVSLKWPAKTLFNLIQFNDIEKFKGSDMEIIQKFKIALINVGYKCFIRNSRGKDIGAACGMLQY